MGSASTLRLPFGDHAHAFDAAQKDARAAEILDRQHEARTSLDRAMVLLGEVIEIF